MYLLLLDWTTAILSYQDDLKALKFILSSLYLLPGKFRLKF